jgi:hypothetical protein
MQISKLNRDGQEKIIITANNVHGATITTGLPVAYAVGASNDGASVVGLGAAGANTPGFLGVALEDIPNNSVGRFQIAGFVNSILLSNFGSSVTVNSGDPLVPAAGGFASAAPTYANSGFRWLFASNVPAVLSTASYASGLIRMI